MTLENSIQRKTKKNVEKPNPLHQSDLSLQPLDAFLMLRFRFSIHQQKERNQPRNWLSNTIFSSRCQILWYYDLEQSSNFLNCTRQYFKFWMESINVFYHCLTHFYLESKFGILGYLSSYFFPPTLLSTKIYQVSFVYS